MKNELPAKRLAQDKVTKYAKLCAQIDSLEKSRKKLRERLIKQMEAGYVCPQRGPYLLLLTYQERHPIAWKEEWMDVAKQLYGAKRRKAVLKALYENAELVKTPMLLPRVNAKYRQKDNIVEFKKDVA